MKIKPLIAYCIVDKKKPVIQYVDIYSEKSAKECRLDKNETLIKVIIKPYVK